MRALFLAFFIIFPLSFIGSLAQENSVNSLFPNVAKAIGNPHPEGSEYWRINHPDLLRHDRDKVVRDGERKIDASIKQCVTCHAVFGDDEKPVKADSEQFFCATCHEFAAVKIDCFSCHTSDPDVNFLEEALAQYNPNSGISDKQIEMMRAYLLKEKK